MPPRQRTPNEAAQQIVPLLLLGIGLVMTNNSITIIDDEATIVGDAASPAWTILRPFLFGKGRHEHPPLYDLLLHFWLQSTGGNFNYLRLPSILFFLAGLFLLGHSSRHFAARFAGSTTGLSAGIAVIWLGVLWPFSFHFGRLAAWYSFSFFLVAGLTLSYLKYLEEQTPSRMAVLFAFCVALVWTNYFGWALLACLALDQYLRSRAKEPAAPLKSILEIAALVCVCFVPLFPAFRSELGTGIVLHQRALTILANSAFNVFSFFTSESIAPWYWWLSIPAGLAILSAVALAAWWLPRPVRRFLYYSAFLIVVMALIGILRTKYLLLLAPWILLPVGVAIDSAKPRWATFGLAAALLVIGGAGWYGVYSRRYYSAPRFLEPWQEVAGDAAAKLHSGGKVIADHPSFLLYLTYILPAPKEDGLWKFEGNLPETVQYPGVFSPQAWLAAGHSTSGKIILIRGGRDLGESGPLDEAAKLLDQSCGSISSRLRMRDEGFKWKQRFFPNLGEPQWRIEIREYDCDSTNSKQIYPLPPR